MGPKARRVLQKSNDLLPIIIALALMTMTGCASYKYSAEDGGNISEEKKMQICQELDKQRSASCRHSEIYGTLARQNSAGGRTADAGEAAGVTMCEVNRDDARKSWDTIGCESVWEKTPQGMANAKLREEQYRIWIEEKRLKEIKEAEYAAKYPIHAALKAGNLDQVKKSLSAKANPNAMDSNGKAPLHIACEYSRHIEVELLINYGANVNLKDAARKEAPLDVCLGRLQSRGSESRLEAVRILMRKGARKIADLP